MTPRAAVFAERARGSAAPVTRRRRARTSGWPPSPGPSRSCRWLRGCARLPRPVSGRRGRSGVPRPVRDAAALERPEAGRGGQRTSPSRPRSRPNPPHRCSGWIRRRATARAVRVAARCQSCSDHRSRRTRLAHRRRLHLRRGLRVGAARAARTHHRQRRSGHGNPVGHRVAREIPQTKPATPTAAATTVAAASSGSRRPGRSTRTYRRQATARPPTAAARRSTDLRDAATGAGAVGGGAPVPERSSAGPRAPVRSSEPVRSVLRSPSTTAASRTSPGTCPTPEELARPRRVAVDR